MGRGRGRFAQISLLAALLCGAAACHDVPEASEAVSAATPTLALEAQKVRFRFFDPYGLPVIVFNADEVPDAARHAVYVHVAGESPERLVAGVAYAADLTRTGQRGVLLPDELVRARAHAARAGQWAARGIFDMAEIAGSASPVFGEPTRRLDLERVPEEQRLRVKLEQVDGLAAQRRLRNTAVARPTPRDFGLTHEVPVASTLVFVRRECESCADVLGWLEGRGVAHRVVEIRVDAWKEALKFVAKQAKVPVAVPMVWTPRRVVVGFDPEALEEAVDASAVLHDERGKR